MKRAAVSVFSDEMLRHLVLPIPHASPYPPSSVAPIHSYPFGACAALPVAQPKLSYPIIPGPSPSSFFSLFFFFLSVLCCFVLLVPPLLLAVFPVSATPFVLPATRSRARPCSPSALRQYGRLKGSRDTVIGSRSRVCFTTTAPLRLARNSSD